MPNRILLWTDTPAAYLEAAAPFGDRATIETLPRGQSPSPEQCGETTAMLAWGAPAGLLPKMTALRWVQALTAGVESWLALPDLPPALTLTCARGTHRESMPENILGALFHIAKPYAVIAQTQATHQWTRRMAMP
jgi:phosphoglycerate dehydrogenase-like enzyme